MFFEEKAGGLDNEAAIDFQLSGQFEMWEVLFKVVLDALHRSNAKDKLEDSVFVLLDYELHNLITVELSKFVTEGRKTFVQDAVECGLSY